MPKAGCIYAITFSYQDIVSDSIKAKIRPFLIIKEEDGKYPKDLSCLPISRITSAGRINRKQDIKIEKEKYPLLCLNAEVSYIRINKLQTINEKELAYKISDNCSNEYKELYDEIKRKVKEFYGSIDWRYNRYAKIATISFTMRKVDISYQKEQVENSICSFFIVF